MNFSEWNNEQLEQEYAKQADLFLKKNQIKNEEKLLENTQSKRGFISNKEG